MFEKQTARLARLIPDWAFNPFAAKRRPRFNPTISTEQRKEPESVAYTLFRYNEDGYEEKNLTDDESCQLYTQKDSVVWINIDGLKRDEIAKIGTCYNIHYLILEDILSIGQRAKMDETGNVIFCLLPMLYYNEGTGQVETEQVSMVLGENFVLSFQEDPVRDVFDPVRERIRSGQLKLRQSGADFLCYSLIDIIVDSYFAIIERLNERIERLEDNMIIQKEKAAMAKISLLRREVMTLRRSILPVRDLVSAFVRSDSDLLDRTHKKYFKDVLDHIIQANDYVESNRDMLVNLQDLSMSQINLRMNEVMKVFTLLATLMAPATVIGGIFGMNFEVIPLTHQYEGFYIAVGAMLLIPTLMMIYFKRKGWF
ncbi:MAG: magnesium/cobalt transporter CorA [Sphingobacteriales bacterium]|nr:MAG: magnesium/cobalt transporter CorA [Sphingobacteriales bacterium]